MSKSEFLKKKNGTAGEILCEEIILLTVSANSVRLNAGGCPAHLHQTQLFGRIKCVRKCFLAVYKLSQSFVCVSIWIVNIKLPQDHADFSIAAILLSPIPCGASCHYESAPAIVFIHLQFYCAHDFESLRRVVQKQTNSHSLVQIRMSLPPPLQWFSFENTSKKWRGLWSIQGIRELGAGPKRGTRAAGVPSSSTARPLRTSPCEFF